MNIYISFMGRCCSGTSHLSDEAQRLPHLLTRCLFNGMPFFHTRHFYESQDRRISCDKGMGCVWNALAISDVI